MDKKRKIRNYLLAFIVFLLLAALIFFGFRFISLWRQSNAPLPMVLIHRPYNNQEVSLEDGIAIHSTARAEDGISRMELWVDGKFITSQEAPESGPISPLILHSNWLPKGEGTHEIIVRAYDEKNNQGIGSILITVLSTDELPEVAYNPFEEEVESSDTEDAGEESSEETPPASDGSPPPSGGGDGHAEVPAEEGSPPTDDAPPPYLQLADFTLMSIFDFAPIGEEGDQDPLSTNNMLELETLSLTTDGVYEGVHCYIGLGENSPRWYPDTDFDQSTDENFSMIEPGRWDVADSVSYQIYWDVSQPAPFTVSCVAHTNGGTEAISLGLVEVIIQPSEFDGITRSISASDEGSFELAYRITQGSLTTKDEDESIPIPYNLRINDRRQELEWDWDPGEEGESAGVVGFLIFVNDNLVFTISGREVRAVRLPYVWFSPPCRAGYDLTVRAYKSPYPDNDYSVSSEIISIPDPSDPARTDCQPEFIVEFHTLTTGEFSGDGRPNNWAGLVGPVSGYFFANDQDVNFQGVDMQPNRSFDLPDLIYETTGTMASFILEPVPGENVRVGFDLAIYRGWDGFDDFCTTALYHDYSFNQLMEYGYFEETLYSHEDEGRKCQITYTIRPLGGSAFGTGNPDFIPLPWLDVVDMKLESMEANLIVEVRNTGSAAWVNQDLRIHFDNRESSWQADHIEQDLVLEVGESKEILTTIRGLNFSQICVTLDPDNSVLELYESTGALYHATTPYCPQRPDLRITDAVYDFETNNLRVHIWNTGENTGSFGSSDFDVRDLMIKIDSSTTSDEYRVGPDFFGETEIRRGGDMWFEIPVNAAARTWMDEGYTVIIDPEDWVYETNEDNNELEIRGGETVRVVWSGMHLKWYPTNALQECTNYGRWNSNSVDVNVSVNASSAYSDQRITSWSWDGRVNESDLYLPAEMHSRYSWDSNARVAEFFIRGEEDIVISVNGEQGTHSMGSSTGTFSSDVNWLAINHITPAGSCLARNSDGYLLRGIPISVSPTYHRFSGCMNSWVVYINVCTIAD
ncbi:MAG: hypothetical protein HON98_08520 [Chloroflexi bacterium]|jgi:hypothetical protein|nr:hypothetical protein [Chloroflexota bacterium]MBT3669986.1 hypothetical protein [Chloroflexota bacterium]MBT4534610.1 hypothetical protein [Chloroflexota bacterium]MBT4682670.1 hypothetical protein [Chloroflexota bacterium]MBT4755712.1 hypothetical protein [Chloroflexota bacterium]